jgi:hypothetical protein
MHTKFHSENPKGTDYSGDWHKWEDTVKIYLKIRVYQK